MKIRVRRKFAHLQPVTHLQRHRWYCLRKYCGLSLLCSGGIYCLAICIIFVVFLFFFTQPCNNHTDCQTNNPCSIDQCVHNMCRHTKKESCCITDNDCHDLQCYSSFCDKFTHKCQAIQANNGTQCIDTDSCTIDDQCYGGQCVGKTLSCHSDNTCITGECRAKEGCMFRNNPDGIGCNDNNPCTLNDECYNGMCAVSIPKDCSYLDTFCTVGACDILTGDCIELPRNEGADCDDGLQCTLDDKCVTGKCKGHQNECFDNNPCTINVCTEESGCTVQYETETGQCIPGCTQDSECPLGFNCFDGTCVKTQRIQEQHIRMIGYEVEDCTSTASSRLIQHFVLDTKEIDFNGEKRFRIIKDPSDIVFNPRYAPLGFGDEVINLAYNHFGNGMARTSFSIATQCQTYTKENCNFIFSNREYRFMADTHDCANINGLAYGCLKMNHILELSIELSLSTCNKFEGGANINYPRGRAVVIYHGITYKDRWNAITETDNETRGIVGIETTTTDAVLPIISDMRICQGSPDHHLGSCVDRTNTSMCFNQGCFNWDPNDSPLSFSADIIVDEVVTALALSNVFLASGCYPNDDYNSPYKCDFTKCNLHGLDDFFEMSFSQLNNKENYVFDIKYKINLCGSRRRLLSVNNTKYAMAIVKLH